MKKGGRSVVVGVAERLWRIVVYLCILYGCSYVLKLLTGLESQSVEI